MSSLTLQCASNPRDSIEIEPAEGGPSRWFSRIPSESDPLMETLILPCNAVPEDSLHIIPYVWDQEILISINAEAVALSRDSVILLSRHLSDFLEATNE